MLSAVLAASLSCTAPADIGADFVVHGEAKYKKAIFNLYRARLCAPAHTFAWETDPFALRLSYLRGFTSEQLLKATFIEMERLSGKPAETFEALHEPMRRCFPNVQKGDTIVGYSPSVDTAEFYYNGELACEIRWPNFRRDFFGIWLSDRSRVAKKKDELLGRE